jgi:hypothetical protein
MALVIPDWNWLSGRGGDAAIRISSRAAERESSIDKSRVVSIIAEYVSLLVWVRVEHGGVLYGCKSRQECGGTPGQACPECLRPSLLVTLRMLSTKYRVLVSPLCHTKSRTG